MDLLSPALPFIENLQKIRELLPLMKLLSALGSEQFYLLLLPLIYWGVSRPLGVRLGALLLFSVVVNEIFKVAFAQPRPYWIDANLLISKGSAEASFGFPSGHAQNAILIWPFLALQTKRKGLWMSLAILLAAGISFSRIYLGVHYPTDILGGFLIGLAIIGGYRLGGPAWMRLWNQLSLGQKLFLGAFSTSLLVGAYGLAVSFGAYRVGTNFGDSNFDAVTNAMVWANISARLGAYLGLVIAAALASRYVRFEALTSKQVRALRYLIGFFGLIAVYVGLAKLFPDGPIWKALRYGLTTFWVVFLAPLVFSKLPSRQKIEA